MYGPSKSDDIHRVRSRVEEEGPGKEGRPRVQSGFLEVGFRQTPGRRLCPSREEVRRDPSGERGGGRSRRVEVIVKDGSELDTQEDLSSSNDEFLR